MNRIGETAALALGASGAIAAVMGAFIVTYRRDRIKAVLFIFIFVRITFIPAALLIGVWFLMQLVHAGAVAQVQTGGVACLAHVGGFIFGALAANLFESSRRVSVTRIDKRLSRSAFSSIPRPGQYCNSMLASLVAVDRPSGFVDRFHIW